MKDFMKLFFFCIISFLQRRIYATLLSFGKVVQVDVKKLKYFGWTPLSVR